MNAAANHHGGLFTGQQSRLPPGIFCKSYRCHSMACLDRKGLEFGDKIIMPQMAFQEAHRLRLKLPLLFKLVNTNAHNRGMGTAGPPTCQFCGVLEFSAPEDQVFLPYWLMQSLLLAEGERVELRSMLRPPAGSFVRFKPHDDIFLDLASRQGPKALMENVLRRYSVLAEGATILVQHEGENFYLEVEEVRTLAAVRMASDGESSEHGVTDAGNDTHTGTGDKCGALVTSAGRRVRLVCLLGDLDLEVEFSSPPARAPLPGSGYPTPEAQARNVSPQRYGNRHDEGRWSLADEDRHRKDAEAGGDISRPTGSRGPVNNETASSVRPPQGAAPCWSKRLPVRAAVAASDLLPASASARRGSAPPQTATGCSPRRQGGGSQHGTGGLALPRPAPAKARKGPDGDTPGRVEAEPAPGMMGPWRPRQGGVIQPPSPPSLTRDFATRTVTCRAFPGKGVSLLGSTGEEPPHFARCREPLLNARHTNDVQRRAGPWPGAAETRDEDEDEDEDEDPREGRGPGASEERLLRRGGSVGRGGRGRGGEGGGSGLFTSDGGSGELGGNSGSGRPSLIADSAENIIGNGSSLPRETSRKGGAVGGRVLGRGSSAAAASTTLPPASDEARSAAGAREPLCGASGAGATSTLENVQEVKVDAEQTACGTCGRLVPKVNLRLHELRCRPSSTDPAAAVAAARRQGREQITSESSSPSSPSGQFAYIAASKQATSPVRGGSRDCRLAPANTTTNEMETASVAGVAASAAATPTAPSEISCTYCGLRFREVGPAAEHKEECAARTERCDRCCGHVPHRDAESHRRPGGVCDATIAAAKIIEAQAIAYAAAATGTSSSGWDGALSSTIYGSDSGSGCGGGVGDRGGGRFDALLAEAVRTSRAAATALVDARARNIARMEQTFGVIPYAGKSAPQSRLCLDRRNHGGAGDGDFARNLAEEAVADRNERVAEGEKTRAAPVLSTFDSANGRGVNDGTNSRPCGSDSGRGGISAGQQHRRTLVGVSTPRAEGTQSGAGALFPISFLPSSSSSPSMSAGKASNSTPPTVSATLPMTPLPPNLAKSNCSSGGGTGGRHLHGRPWACSSCTLMNPERSTFCDMCGSAAPVLSAERSDTAAADVQPDEVVTAAPTSAESAALGGASNEACAEKAVNGASAGVGPDAGAGEDVVAAESFTTMASSSSSGSPARGQASAEDAALSCPPSPPRGASPLKASRFRREGPPGPGRAAAAPLLPLPTDATADSSKENIRGSGSAPRQPRRARDDAITFGDVAAAGERKIAVGHAALPLQARRTAPAAPMHGGELGQVAGTRFAGPNVRNLRPPVKFSPADVSLAPPRRDRLIAAAEVSRTAQRQRQGQRQQNGHAMRLTRATSRSREKQGGPRRIMGPPRRLGGAHRPTRLPFVNPSVPPCSSSSSSSPLSPAADNAATVVHPPSRFIRAPHEAGGRHDHHHHQRQSEEELNNAHPAAASTAPLLRNPYQGGGGDSGSRIGGVGRRNAASHATSSPPPTAAPASDQSLSILGISQGDRGNKNLRQGRAVIGGGRARDAVAGSVASLSRARPGQSGEDLGHGGSGGGGDSRSGGSGNGSGDGGGCGGDRGGGRGVHGRAELMGVAPLKLRRRVSRTRMLEPLFAE